MSRVVRIQTNFSSGEIDPALRARIDLEQYYNGLETASNVVILPQGGAKRRDGLKFVYELPSAAAPQNGVRLIPFEFSTDDSYMFAVTHQRIYIFRNKALVTNINGSGNDYLAVTAITSAMLSTLKFAQAADTIVFTHEDLAPLKIVRGASHTAWTVSTITFTNIPQYAYTLATSTPTGTIIPSGTTGSITLRATATATITIVSHGDFNNEEVITLTAGDGTEHKFYSSNVVSGGNYFSRNTSNNATATSLNAAINRNNKFKATVSGAVVTISQQANSATTTGMDTFVKLENIDTGKWNSTSFTSASVFASSYEGQYINIKDTYGRLRVVEYISASEIKCFAEIDLYDTKAIETNGWELESGYVDAWSASKGYPVSCIFHEGRLFFAGSKSLPISIWGSKVADYFNFDSGTGLDDEAISATIATTSLNSISDVYSGRDLQIFTSGGEFYIPQITNTPITPGNLTVKTATRNGTKIGVPVVGLDSGTLFIQRQGKALNELVFTDAELAYTTSQVSVLSSHLLKSPVDMALRRATSTDESDRLFIVNGTDGTMSVFSLLRSQKVIAPSSFTTDGLFKAIGVDIDTVYSVIQRTIGGAAKYYVEWFDETLHTDSAVYSASASATGTAAHLNGEVLNTIVDGAVQTNKTVSSNTVTFDSASSSNYEIGLPFVINVKTLPIEARLPSGPARGMKKRIIEVVGDVKDSQALTINNYLISFRNFGEATDSPITAFTGNKKTGTMLGFADEVAVTVTQSVPLDLHLLSLEYKMSIGA